MHMQTNTDKDLPVTPAQDAAFTRFTTRYDQILDCIEAVDPAAYARTRNFADGAVIPEFQVFRFSAFSLPGNTDE